MNSKQNKIPMLYIGLIAFLAVAVIGIVYDFISKSGGMIAIIAVAVAFIVLAVFLVIDIMGRKRAAKLAEQDGDAPFSEENRFLRHADRDDSAFAPTYSDSPFGSASSDSGFSFDSAPADFSESESDCGLFSSRRRMRHRDAEQMWENDTDTGFADGFSDTDGLSDDFSDSADNGFDSFAADADLFARATDGSIASDISDAPADTAPELVYTELAPAAAGFAVQTADTADSDIVSDSAPVSDDNTYSAPIEDIPAQAEDDPFKPVLKLDPPTAKKAAEKLPAQEPVQEPVKEETAVPAAPIFDPSASKATAVAETPAQPAAPKANRAAAAPAGAVISSEAPGQRIEDFYSAMGDDELLYRDCVEVWAADAKPCMLRLIKLIDSIEDKQLASRLGRECEYANAMIDRINGFTQLEYIDEQLDLKTYNFSAMVKECLRRFSPFMTEKRLGLLWKGLDIDVITDRRWFIFALTQVIFNAVEFTPQGGKIAISAKKADDYISLMVEDSGKGISPEEMPYIFVAGYMGDDAPNEHNRRTGMGLFIAQSVMRKMGGDMLAESTPGKGTRITMRLPNRQ